MLKQIFVSFVLILILSIVIKGSHFNGGSITWSPLNPDDNSSSVMIIITQTYYYTYPTVNCTINVPMTTPAYNTTGTVYLNCVANCSTDGNYTYKKLNILTDCISASLSLGVLTSQRSTNMTFPIQTYFWICNSDASWRSLANFVNNSDPAWDIVSLIDLRIRPDGIINTPPTAHVTSPQYVIVNVTTTIVIPVSDVNTDDDIRCRWSSSNSSFGVNECGAICAASSILPSNTILSNCTLTFMSTVSGVWYGVAFQVEDFINTASTDPMSSVPIQFLIYVLPTPKCPQPPIILPITDCLEVEVNVSITFILYAMDFCNRTRSTINNIIPTTFINGMEIGNIINSTTNTSLVYTTLTWTPTLDQMESQLFCAVAYTNEKVQSDTYCVTFNVTTSQPCLTTTTTQTTTTTSQSTTTQTTTTTSQTTTAQTTTTTSQTTTTQTTTTISETITTQTTTTTSKTTTTQTTTTISETITTTSITIISTSTTSETATVPITSTTTISSTTTTVSATISTSSTTTESTTISTTIVSTTQTTSINSITTIPNSIASKTQSSGSNQMNLPLIVCLSLLALLLALCCCCCWLYHLLWSAAARQRRLNKNTKPLKQPNQIEKRLRQQQNYELYHQNKRSQDYIKSNESDYKNTTSNASSRNSTETTLLSTTTNKRQKNIRHTQVNKIKKSSKEENTSVESDYQENISKQENKSKKSHSLITVTPMKKLTKDSQNIELSRSSKVQEEEHKYPLRSSNDVHVSKLSKNKISSSSNTSQLNNHQSTTKIIQILNTDQDKQLSHINSLNVKSDTHGRKRASSFGGVNVRRIKTNINNRKSFLDNYNTNNRVSVILVKKE